MADWYYYEDEEKIGPFSASDLRHKVREGVITRSTRVRREDMDQRVPAEKVTGLFKPSRARSGTHGGTEEVYVAAPKSIHPMVGLLGFILALALVGGAIYGVIFLLESKSSNGAHGSHSDAHEHSNGTSTFNQ